ncbi:hypothetical protein L6452_21446 [Arctium lappa]|uniref:Uncharacterized protein n=1 Tax=Arctium lappa TaxID=4217 RepID=A0ACB9AYD4_ARCLA|nr:hypothetical protein L6452_21446 [Arctium lappa]
MIVDALSLVLQVTNFIQEWIVGGHLSFSYCVSILIATKTAFTNSNPFGFWIFLHFRYWSERQCCWIKNSNLLSSVSKHCA